jgi:hypothetical protein
MKISDVEIFESYLSGSLSGDSLKNFKQKLQKSKAFKSDFEAYKTAFEALNEEPKWNETIDLVNNLRDNIQAEREGYFSAYNSGKLSEEEQEIFEDNLKEDELLNFQFNKFKNPEQYQKSTPQPTTKEAKIISFRSSRFTRVISIAAMLVLAIGTFWWVNNNNQANDQLFAAYYEVPNTNVVKMDWTEKAQGTKMTSSELLEMKDKAIQEFEAGNWHQAIEGFDNYVKNSEKTDDTYYLLVYAGVSYMELGLYDKAIETLTFSMENIKDVVNNSRRKETVQWYLALANLKNGNNEKFVELAQSLTQGTNKKVREKANKLLCEYKIEFCETTK